MSNNKMIYLGQGEKKCANCTGRVQDHIPARFNSILEDEILAFGGLTASAVSDRGCWLCLVGAICSQQPIPGYIVQVIAAMWMP